MEDLLALQQQLLNQIEQTYTNFKKDGSDRKNADYIRRRLETLDACWKEYESNHVKLCNIEYAKSHSYFTSKQFECAKERYENIRAFIQNYKLTEERPSTPLLKPATPLAGSSAVQQPTGQLSRSQGSNSKTDEMMRKQISNFKAFEHTVSSINLESVEEKWEFDHLLSTIRARWSKIDTQHWELDSELGDRNQEYHSMYLKYERAYNDAIKAINKKMWSISHREHTTPKIDIPTFSGSYHQWTSFKDLFTESIHSNPSLSGAQKMQFLKSKVKGEAERLIQHLPISSDNYIISWNILSNRYDNKRMIFTSHINILLNLPVSQQASINHIKRIHDTALETMNAIQNLGVDVKSWDPLIVHILGQKLDSDTFSEYNAAIKQPRELLELNEFLAFLEGKFTSMEASRRKQEDRRDQKQFSPNNNYKSSESKPYHFKQTYSSNKAISQFPSYRKLQVFRQNCPVCNDAHALFYCKQFAEMTPIKRKQCVTNLNYCKNCLYDHKGKACLSKKRCVECNEFHNTLLHESYSNELSKQGGNPMPSTSAQKSNVISNQERVANKGNTHVTQQSMMQETLLSTALLKVQKADGTFLIMRALIDQGSQMSLITENGAQQLGLPRYRCDGVITGIGQTENNCKGMVSVNCMSRINQYHFNIDVYIMKNLTKYLPSYSFPKLECPFLENIELADPEYNISRPVDMLLGADVYSNILLTGMCRLSESLPIVQETRLGWILCGSLKTNFVCNVVQVDLDRFQQFWEIEEVTEQKSLSSEEQECMQYYKATTKRLSDGRYEVRLPLKPHFEENLGQSKNKAIAQFINLEKKLHKNNSIFNAYKSFITEYLELGHMKPSTCNQTPECFLPHHCVMRDDSSTTALRVVYNASAKTSSNKSLNDFMYTGPNLQQDLQFLIIKWRQYQYAFTADIEKMFRQIWVHSDDQALQKIIWRDNPSQKLQEYQLTTVTYGTKAAPFLAMMTLRQLAEDERDKFPEAAKVIEESFYMDDLVHGASSLSTAQRLQQDLIDLLKLGGFNLRKWASNDSRLLQSRDSDYHDQESKSFQQTESTKTLGLRWNPKHDNFTFISKIESSNTNITKRKILSDMSKIFDPLGWIVPVTTKMKILFQEVWLTNFDWDEQVSEKLSKEWIKIKEELETINQFKIPRWYGTVTACGVELHGFCDASTKAYACVIYCRLKYNKQSIILVAAKSKLVPLKKHISLPRLELCGALLLAKLMAKVKKCLEGQELHVFGWSDSTAVLGWLQGNPSRWKTFVSNRTTQITDIIPPQSWRYVKSSENPADCGSRGLTASQLQDYHMWWQGPTWLKSFEEKIENQAIYKTEEEVKEKKEVNVATKQEPSIITSLLNKHNSISKIFRILALVMKFTTYKRKAKKHYLSLSDISKAKNKIIKHIQQEEFAREINDLKQEGKLSSKSKLLKLNPYLDENDILRVGGRLKKAHISQEMQHPIILPHSERFTELIIQDAHLTMLHAGSRLTLSFIRQKYWILGGNVVTKRLLRRCVTCKKQNPDCQQQIMGHLPEARCNPSRPFTHTGVDFTGHIYVKASKGRGIKTTKGYVAVFVCMVTKAVHLELVCDLSTSSFIAALRRMAARRGTPTHMYSDNGRNFVGANKVINQEYQSLINIMEHKEIKAELLDMEIEWSFNAPSWPSAGGLWEAAVRSFKYHFKRVIGDQILTYEEFKYTVLTQIEACLNTRLLCPISEDPDDVDFLTPAHFLTGGSKVTLNETETDLRTRWQLTQKIVQDLWKRWRNEYLVQLTERSKWRQARRNLQENDIVMIHDDNLPPGKWLMGRVIDLHPGSDGHVRVVTVKTKNGTLKRPVTKLSLLPINNESPQINPKHTADSENSTTNPRTMKTNTRFNIASVFAAIMLFFSIITTSQCALNVTKFRDNQHIYFDKLSNMQIIRDEWKLIIYYDLDPYWEGITTLNKSIQSLEQSCRPIRDQTNCDLIILQLRHGYHELEYNNHILLGQHFNNQANRWRRGLIDGVGYIANGLFGVLDARFAEQYARDITLLRNNQKHIVSFWQNQTSVIEAEFSLLKRTETTMHKQHKIIHQQFSKIENAVETLKNETQNILRATEVSMGAVVANNLLRHLKDLQNALVDTMTDIYHGRFNPHLITAEQLQDQLSTIASHLSNDVILPIDNIYTGLAQLFKLLQVKARMLKNYAIFEVQIPLISRDSYEIFKLIPIPAERSNNTMMSVKPISDIIAVNLKKDAYIILTETMLDSCLLTNVHLCSIHSPVYKLSKDKDFCQSKTSVLCEVSIDPCKNLWVESNTINNYIYFCCGKCKLRTVCGNQVNAHQLTHSGLITVDFGCIIKSDNFEVIAHQQRTSDVSISAKVFSPVIASINHVINVTIPQDVLNESSKESDQELESIQDRIKTMKENGVIEESMSYHDIHHYTVIYGVIIVVAAGLGVYACRRARCARAPAPAAPAPGGATSSNVPASQHVASVGDSVVYQCVSERAKVASARVLDKATSPVLGSYTSISNL